MAAKAEVLLAELGSSALGEGRWNNGIGQMGLHLTLDGLKMLASSSNAISFRGGEDWRARTHLNGSDGSLDAVEASLAANQYADVVLTLNASGLAFDADASGSLTFQPTATTLADALRKFAEISNRVVSRGRLSATSAAALRAAVAGGAAQVTVRLDRRDVLALASSQNVRHMQPVGFTDSRPLAINSDVFAEATKSGSADVIITLRNALASGNLTAASQQAQKAFHIRAVEAIKAASGVRGSLSILPNLGNATGRLSIAELNAIRARNDRRVLSIELNRPMGHPLLSTSMPLINMPAAWAAGYRSADQYIIVMDTGAQSNHLFLRDAAGNSRVVFEACFGTNTTANGVTYQSVCAMPAGQDPSTWNGDSVLGQAGSAAPVANCSTLFPNSCKHGTHVSGIAAGRFYSGLPTNTQGMAPDAGLVALQVFSYDQQRAAQPTFFVGDLVTAMEAAAAAMVSGTLSNPYTINLSLGWMGPTNSGYGGQCASVSTAFSNAVLSLYNNGVPVVAATGNDGSNASIAWPACVPKVIKVSAVRSDTAGTARAAFANVVNPALFPSEYFFFAPGGADTGGGTTILSSVSSPATNAAFNTMSGTSQAAPQLAGLYAALKAAVPGISVSDSSIWIRDTGSIPMTVSTCTVGPCAPSESFSVRRIRIPNF